MASALNDALGFLDKMGLFDVVLPFLLVYVMIFAILERTKIFGTEKFEGEEIPKKNLNAIFAFAVAFFTILSAKVVGTINRAIGPVMVLMISIVLFLMLASVFRKEEEGYASTLSAGAKRALTGFIMIVITLIFLGSITNDKGETWLNAGWAYITTSTNSGHVGAVLLLLFMAGLVYWVGKAPSKPSEGGENND